MRPQTFNFHWKYLSTKPLLFKKKNTKVWLKWSTKSLEKDQDFWNNVHLPEESKSELSENKNRGEVWNKTNKAFQEKESSSHLYETGGLRNTLRTLCYIRTREKLKLSPLI